MVWGRGNKLLTCKSKRDLNLPRIQIQPSDKLLLRGVVLAYHREEFQEHSFSKFTDSLINEAERNYDVVLQEGTDHVHRSFFATVSLNV